MRSRPRLTIALVAAVASLWLACGSKKTTRVNGGEDRGDGGSGGACTECHANADCQLGLDCRDGMCTPNNNGFPVQCDNPDACGRSATTAAFVSCENTQCVCHESPFPPHDEPDAAPDDGSDAAPDDEADGSPGDEGDAGDAGDAGADSGPGTVAYAERVTTPGIGSGSANAVSRTPLGDLIIGGFKGTGGSVTLIDVVDGSVTHAHVFDAPSSEVRVTSTAVAANGDVILGGGIGGSIHPWFARMDATGTLLWQVSDSTGSGSASSIAVDGAGNIAALVGTTTSVYGLTGAGVISTRIDLTTAGNPPFLRAVAPAGGGGGWVVAGTLTTGANTDILTIGLNTSLAITTTRIYGGSGTETLAGVAPLEEGVLLSGTTTSSGAGAADQWVARVDAANAILWQKTLGTASTDYGGGVALAGTKVVLVGGVGSRMTAARLDAATGTVEAIRGYANNTNAVGITAFPTPGGIFLVGAPSGQDPLVFDANPDLIVPGCGSPELEGIDLSSSVTSANATLTAGAAPTITATVQPLTSATTTVTSTAGAASVFHECN